MFVKKILFAVAALGVSVAFAAVNINTATVEELQTVKGIGPAKAKAIVEYREKNGAFKSVDDLDHVKGIGKGILEKIRPEVSVDAHQQKKQNAVPAVKHNPAHQGKKN